MKKISISIFLIIVLIFSVSCNKETVDNQPKDEKEESRVLKVAGLKGPTSMGMIKLIDSYHSNENTKFEYSILSSPKELIGKLINEELDFATVPTNMASIIYQKTNGKYKLANINTLNVLHMMSYDQVNSLSDLNGKTIYVSGKGATPEYVTRYIIEKSGLDIELNFKFDDHAALAKALIAGDVENAILPQPFVTTVTMKSEKVNRSFDLLNEWEKVESDSMLALGGLLIKTELIEKDPKIVNQFLDEYKGSVEFVNQNSESTSKLIKKYEILPNEKIALKAIPNSNIVYKDISEVKEKLDKYYKILFDFNKKSIGGKLPDDNFYYLK